MNPKKKKKIDQTNRDQNTNHRFLAPLMAAARRKNPKL